MKTNCNLLILLIISLSSCNSGKIGLVPADSLDAVAMNKQSIRIIDSLNNSGKTALFPITSSSSDQEDFWKSALKSCFQADPVKGNSIFNKNLIYLGPSSNTYLGTVIDDKFRTRTDLSFLKEAELNKFIKTGIEVNNCDLSKVKNISLDFVANANLINSVNGSLAASLKSADSVIVTGGSWRIDELKIDDFLNYVNNNNSQEMKNYKSSLLKNKNKVVTLVIKVNGFSAKAYLKNNITTALQAKLKNNIQLKLDSANASLKFNLASSKTIGITSTNSFYIFANMFKGKKL